MCSSLRLNVLCLSTLHRGKEWPLRLVRHGAQWEGLVGNREQGRVWLKGLMRSLHAGGFSCGADPAASSSSFPVALDLSL